MVDAKIIVHVNPNPHSHSFAAFLLYNYQNSHLLLQYSFNSHHLSAFQCHRTIYCPTLYRIVIITPHDTVLLSIRLEGAIQFCSPFVWKVPWKRTTYREFNASQSHTESRRRLRNIHHNGIICELISTRSSLHESSSNALLGNILFPTRVMKKGFHHKQPISFITILQLPTCFPHESIPHHGP